MKKIAFETIQQCAISVCITAPSVPLSDADISRAYLLPILIRPPLLNWPGFLTHYRRERCMAFGVAQYYCSLTHSTRDANHYLARQFYCDAGGYRRSDSIPAPVFLPSTPPTPLPQLPQPPPSFLTA